MKTIVVFTQNLKISSLAKCGKLEEVLFVTTHSLFENEKEYINKIFGECDFRTFADFLSDKEMAKCDKDSYTSSEMPYEEYLSNIKRIKNDIVISKIEKEYKPEHKLIFSDDLGIDVNEWIRAGYKKINGDYYYYEKISIKQRLAQIKWLNKLYHVFKPYRYLHNPDEVHVGYHNGRKYVFLGKMNRIDYRLNIPFETSVEECERINAGLFEGRETCTYFTTWHEQGKFNVPDEDKYDTRWAQDGYLPPNYSHKDYFFKPKNVKYYCWDALGTLLFKNQGLPYEMIPFRKKLYLPDIIFPEKINNILVVASGSGDWTALKNRSDDDIMVSLIVEMAKIFPNINFTYRCHPTWVHPLHVGVHSIERVHEYFEWLKLPNLTLSSNIPLMNENKSYQYSFSRTSLDDDLKKADFVIGEHSISMIDGAFKGIPFCSVNITGRRNFFVGLNDLGFPSCTSSDELAEMIESVTTPKFKEMFLKAVVNYNKMTDADE